MTSAVRWGGRQIAQGYNWLVEKIAATYTVRPDVYYDTAVLDGIGFATVDNISAATGTISDTSSNTFLSLRDPKQEVWPVSGDYDSRFDTGELFFENVDKVNPGVKSTINFSKMSSQLKVLVEILSSSFIDALEQTKRDLFYIGDGSKIGAGTGMSGKLKLTSLFSIKAGIHDINISKVETGRIISTSEEYMGGGRGKNWKLWDKIF